MTTIFIQVNEFENVCKMAPILSWPQWKRTNWAPSHYLNQWWFLWNGPFKTNPMKFLTKYHLTHWGQVTHVCIGNLTIIGSDNGLAPTRRQAIIWTNAGILLIGPLGTNLSQILITFHTFPCKKMHLKRLSVKWQPFCQCVKKLYLKISPTKCQSSCPDLTVLIVMKPYQVLHNSPNCHPL